MEQHNTIPLGFSDLNQDESMLISIFRVWYTQKESQDEIEASLQMLLKEDKIYPALTDVFHFFRRFTHLRLVHINDNEVLSSTEEYLLKVLGSTDQYHDSIGQRCRERLRSTMTILRPIDSIERSGYDLVQQKIAESYLKFVISPP